MPPRPSTPAGALCRLVLVPLLAGALVGGARAQAPHLKDAEDAWLRAQGGVVHVGAEGRRPPVDFFDGDRHAGILADYLMLLAATTDIRFVTGDGSNHMVPTAAGPMVRFGSTLDDLGAGWVATPACVRIPVVIVVRQGSDALEDVADLRGRRVGVPLGGGLSEVIRARVDGLQLTGQPTVRDALDTLGAGGLDAVVAELPCAVYAMRTLGLGGLHIAGSAGLVAEWVLWVRADLPLLHSMLSDAIACVLPEARDGVFARWMQTERTSGWLWGLWVLAAGAAALLGVLAWNRTLARRVTARTAEVAAERAKREHSERLATLGTLVASVAHEVNNPNHAIMLNAPVLAAAWRDALTILDQHAARNPGLRLANVPFHEMREDVARMVDEIERSAGRIRDIVAAMRGYARDQSRQEQSTFDFVAAVRAGIASRRELIEESCQAFRADLPNTAAPVLGSHLQIEQLVAQLLSNACQGLTDPSQPIQISAHIEASPRRVVLEVMDRGRGIPEDRLQEVVRPFSTSRGGDVGIGLGLSLAAWIVQQHRGKLAIESAAATGTRVIVSLPLAAI